MPKEAETKPEHVKADILRLNPKLTIRNSREEPIAFGLVALIADFVTDDESGAMEEIENSIRASELVGEFEVMGSSRISATVRK